MKEVKRYKCDYCGKEWTSLEKCVDCEDSHLVPKKILCFEYDYTLSVDGMSINPFDKSINTRAPKSITVELSNGRKQTYYREKL